MSKFGGWIVVLVISAALGYKSGLWLFDTWSCGDLEQGKYWLAVWELDKVVVGDRALDWLVCIWKTPSAESFAIQELASPGRASLSLANRAL